ncbi:MAG: hypothetical protein NWQ13_06610, partial [Glaciimonas sp.]|nr:hypothetical protein [Glaciimonas sp.]
VQLPASFLSENWIDNERKWALPRCLTFGNIKCDAYLINLNDSEKSDILLIETESVTNALMVLGENGHWGKVGSVPNAFATCPSLRKKLQAGDYNIIPARIKNLEIAGQRIEIENSGDTIVCEDQKK